MLFVSVNMVSTATAQEISTDSKPQNTAVAESSEDRALVASIMADSTHYNRVNTTEIYPLIYLNITDSPRIDTIFIARNIPTTQSVDSLSVAAEKPAEEVAPGAYKNRTVKWGGRDRYGRFTDQCAAHVNGRLKKFGYYSQGHAYQIPYHYPSVINGYLKAKIPDLSTVSPEKRASAVLNMHREASDYVKKHLDISKLVPGKYYVVNMYYTTSPYMLEFFYAAKEQGTYNYGTHVGVLYYNTEYQTWIVEHNIHGHVHYDALVSILGGLSNPHKYGVTSISRVRK
jgi:hypothetical protein